MPVDEVRKLINAIDNNNTGFNSPPFKPFISKRLRELVGIPEPIDKQQQQQQMKNMQELLNRLVTNLNANNDNNV